MGQRVKDDSDVVHGDPSAIAPTTVGLHGICDLRLVDLEEWPEFFEDMRGGILKECKRHGNVIALCVDETAPFGSAFVRFAAPSEAEACRVAMDKRYFAGYPVTAEIDSNELWKSPP